MSTPQPASSSAPTFTVIVPTYRRPRQLALCLQSLADQRFPQSRYEVVVVNDAGAEVVVEEVVRSVTGITCRLRTQAHLGASAARNAGAAVARGRLLAFTDDDCRPAADWLSRLEQAMASYPEPVLVGGCVVNALPEQLCASASQALIDFLYAHFNRSHDRATLLTSNNLCISADAFQALGGFDPAFPGAGGEDRDLCLRWARRGRRLVFVPKAVVYHAHPMTLAGFLRQNLAYGRGAALLRRRALDRDHAALTMEPVSFYRELLRYPRRAPGIERRFSTSALFLLSQLAVGAGYLGGRMAASPSRARSGPTSDGLD